MDWSYSKCNINIRFTFFQAIDLILEEWVMRRKPDSPKNVIMACFEYTSSRDVIKTMGMIDKRNMNSLPAKLFSSIEVHGDKLAEPLKTVSFWNLKF